MNTLALAPRAALILAAALAAACAGAPKIEVPRDPNTSQVTFYRPHSDLHPADYPYIYVDKDRKDALADKAAVTVEVRSGMHQLSLNNPALWDSVQSFSFNAIPGRKFFFRLTVGEADGTESSLPRYVSRFARVDEVSEAAAQAEIAAMTTATKKD